MSYTNLNYHIVFATKERRPWLRGELEKRLSQYIGGIVRRLGGDLLAANGPDDHIHLAIVTTPKVALMDLVRQIKANSSGWIHTEFPELASFAWQDGYSAFTVSRSMLPQVVAYIEDQRKHHSRTSFKEELIALLEKHSVAYDEKYIV